MVLKKNKKYSWRLLLTKSYFLKFSLSLFFLLSLSNNTVFPNEGTVKDTKSFSLKEFIKRALDSSFTLKASKLESASLKSLYSYEKKFYIPRLKINPKIEKSESKASYSYQGVSTIETDSLTGGLSITDTLPYGTDIGLNYNATLEDTNNTSRLINPLYENSLSLSINQSLLKDFIINENIYSLETKKIDYLIGLNKLDRDFSELIYKFIELYWNLYLAREDFDIKSESHKKADAQFISTKKYIEDGILPPVDLYIVEENMIRFKSNLIESKTTYENRVNEFYKTLAIDSVNTDNTTIALSNKPFENLVIDEQKNLLKAKLYSNHNEYNILKLLINRKEFESKFLKNQIKPALKFGFLFSINGLDSNYSNSFSDISTLNSYSGILELNYESPLTYKFEKERFYAVELELRKLKFDLKEREKNMLIEFENSLRTFELYRTQVNLKKRISVLASLKLDAEDQKYKQGISTLNDLVQFQRELDIAKINEVSSLIEWNRSFNNFYKLINELHNYYGISKE